MAEESVNTDWFDKKEAKPEPVNTDWFGKKHAPIQNTVNTDWMHRNNTKEAISEDWLKEAYITTILNGFHDKCQHKKSLSLPENSAIQNPDYDSYHRELTEYKWNNTEEYNLIHATTKKTDFITPTNPNLGWKVHLNVTPEHVKEVSAYLKDNGYNHKYFSGGELENGKVFTVYIGSFKLVNELSKLISQDIGALLARPKASDEVEFAPGVVGRFVALATQASSNNIPEFNQYGTCGYSWSKDAWGKMVNFSAFAKKDPDYKTKLSRLISDGEKESLLSLRQHLGNYFYDESIAGVPWK